MSQYDDATLEEVEKQAFDEEKRNLDDIEDRIDGAIERLDDRIRRAEDEMSFVPVDIEGRTFRADEMRDLGKLKTRRQDYAMRKGDPYFGHIDIRSGDGFPLIMFIGKEALSIAGEQIIVDWRSDMGMVYYDKQSRDYSVKGINYSLLLRRAIHVSEGKLCSVRTEYDASMSEFEGDVVDPFLISVLRDKRRNYQLTDIIKTIQHNQNEIMRLPLNESFIVQGCAGSGKTMILLHRLSYLAYNYKESVDFSRFAILTPSDFFNEHVDDLGEQLGLSMIGRYTIEGYYARLIGRMSATDYAVEEGGGGKEKRKVSVPDSIVLSEDFLGSELLEEVYSDCFVDAVGGGVLSVLSSVLDEASESGLFRLFDRYSLKIPTCDEPAYDAFVDFDRGVRRVRQGSEDAQGEVDEAQKAFDLARLRLERARERKIALDEFFLTSKNGVFEAALEEAGSLESAITSLREEESRLSSSMVSLKRELSSCELKAEKINSKIDSIKEEADRAVKPRDLLDSVTSLGDALRRSCAESLSNALEQARGLASLEIAHVLRTKIERAKLKVAESRLSRHIATSSAVAARQALIEKDNALAELQEAAAKLEAARAAQKEASEQLERASCGVRDLQHHMDELADVKRKIGQKGYLLASNTSVASKLRSFYAPELAQLNAMSEELAELGVLSFSRKRVLSRQISEAEKRILSSVRERLAEFEASAAAALNEACMLFEEAKERDARAAISVRLSEELVARREARLEESKERSRRIASVVSCVEISGMSTVSIEDVVELLQDDALGAEFGDIEVLRDGYRKAALAREAMIANKKGCLRKSEAALDANIFEAVASLVEALRDRLPDEKTVEMLNEKIAELSASIMTVSASITRVLEDGKSIDEMLSALDSETCPGLAELVPVGAGASLKDAVAGYESLRNSLEPETLKAYSEAENRLKTLESLFAEKEKDLIVARGRLVTDEDMLLLSRTGEWRDRLDVRRFLERSGRHLEALYAEHGCAPEKDVFYRHQLFALLATCATYYGSRGLRDKYLSIDEAQDVSSAEYSVLRRVLGPDAVFNLYGDLGQGICKYRGLSSWSDVSDLVSGKVFRLDQNYRNTLQITQFCNDRFGKSTAAIGIEGKQVRQLHIQDAIQEIFALKANEDKLRISMIHKRGLVGLREYFGEFLGKDASWGKVDFSRLSVIDVESSKGLEFDAVIVIINCMAENEEYIAFTRALDNLFVCKIHGLDEVTALNSISASAASSGFPESDDAGEVRMEDVDSLRDALGNREEECGKAEEPDPFDSLFEGMDDLEFKVPGEER